MQTSTIQKLGLGLFVCALVLFTASLALSRFQLSLPAVKTALNHDYQYGFVEARLAPLANQTFGSSFAFMRAYDAAMRQAQQDIKNDLEVVQGLSYRDAAYREGILPDWRLKGMRFDVAKASSTGFLPNNSWLIFFFSIVLGVVGALAYNLPKLRQLPGIKNNHIYHSSMHHRGWLGIATGVWLISFYVLLYFFPEHIVNWIILVDPVSQALNGGEASQWFLYGFLYTLAILVMGGRMLIKYRHNNYQLWRTGSVMFFQLGFAFLLPEILAALHQPAVDLKNIWPLDYSFFFQYRIDKLMASGGFGLFLLFWGMALTVVGVPVFTYFFGKRWYCSWVCGCGGLAETLGDPYRQLSDKSLPAWQIERWLIHAVLVFAIVMTGLTIYGYFGGKIDLKIPRYLLVGAALLLGVGLAWLHRRQHPGVPPTKIFRIIGIVVAVVAGWQALGYWRTEQALATFNQYDVQTIYGFAISSIFAGVVGTGFYPLMGNRVWCRFGCPLAAYLGLVQRFRSRFRITVNGGQCISCGNCSTYCEMGIDVRAYAQRGQDVVRASCVGCGVCAAVCPRGVLRLENAAADVGSRTADLRVIHISEGDVRLLG